MVRQQDEILALTNNNNNNNNNRPATHRRHEHEGRDPTQYRSATITTVSRLALITCLWMKTGPR